MERLLSNTLTTSTSKQNYKSLADIQSTASSSQLIDILITNVWPAAITNFSAAPLPAPELASIGVPPLDDTIRRTKPRYHFAAAGGQPPMFWEREPFVWNDDQDRVSRFVSLGAFGGEPTPGKKQRVRIRVSLDVILEVPRNCSGSTRFLSLPIHPTRRPLRGQRMRHKIRSQRPPSLLRGQRSGRLRARQKGKTSSLATYGSRRNAPESVCNFASVAPLRKSNHVRFAL